MLSIHLELTTESVNSLVEFLRLFRFLSSWLLKILLILLLVFRNFYWIELMRMDEMNNSETVLMAMKKMKYNLE